MSENEMEIIQPFIQENVEIANILKDEFESKLEFIQFVTSLPYCLAPWLSSHVNEEGERRPCEYYEGHGPLHTSPFKEYWNSTFLKNIRKQMLQNNPPEGCLKCVKGPYGKRQKLIYHHLFFQKKQIKKIQLETHNNLQPSSLDYRYLSDEKIKSEFNELINSGKVQHINFYDDEFYISQLSRAVTDNLILRGISREIVLRISNSKLMWENEGINIPHFLSQNFKKVTISINLNDVFNEFGIATGDEIWNRWLVGYYEYKKILGAEMLSFNLKVTIPILMEMSNVTEFLITEGLSFSIDPFYMNEKDWLMSPFSLGYFNLLNVIKTLEYKDQNSQIKNFFESILAQSKNFQLNEFKTNYQSAMVYYSQNNLNTISKNYLSYLNTKIELGQWGQMVSSILYINKNKIIINDNWWQSILPDRLFVKKKSTILIYLKKILRHLPKGLGRSFYKFLFVVQENYIKKINSIDFEAWTRNSLEENYFEFFSSDLDVTIELKSDNDISLNVDLLKKSFKRNPLIKEINFYYPYANSLIWSIYNYFELRRDKVLYQKSPSRFVNNSSIAHKIVFLTRKIQANNHLFNNDYNQRDVLKWTHYFNLCDIPINLSESHNELNATRIFSLLVEIIDLKDEINLFQLEQLIYYINLNIPASILHKEMKLGNNLIALFPHYFCTLNISLEGVAPILEDVFVAQIEWELTSLMTQLNTFSEKRELSTHLENLKMMVLNFTMSSKLAQDGKIKLLNFFDSFEVFLKANHCWDN